MEVSKSVHTKALKLSNSVVPGLFGWIVKGFSVSEDKDNYSCSCGVDCCEHIVAVKLHKKEEIEVVEKSIPKMCIKGLSRYDVVSAFHKELRRGDFGRASYWLEVMIMSNLGAFYTNNYIISIIGEELCLCDATIAVELKALANYKVIDEYALYVMVEKFCEAKKWWFCPKCSTRRDIWVKNHQELQQEEPRRMPSYVFDVHTRKGKALHAEGKADNRWAGTYVGMEWRRRAVEKGLDVLSAQWEDVDMSDEKYLENVDKVW